MRSILLNIVFLDVQFRMLKDYFPLKNWGVEEIAAYNCVRPKVLFILFSIKVILGNVIDAASSWSNLTHEYLHQKEIEK